MDYKKIIQNPLLPIKIVSQDLWISLSPLISSSEFFLKVYFRLMTGKKLNLKSPVSFQEKTQWLKLHMTDAFYTQLVDKYEVRKFVAERIGEKHLIPLLGVYNSFDDIDFNELPNQFVLKPTHDSGSVIICKDKKCFDYDNARRKLTKSLKRNYFYKGREYPYKNVTPRIVAEKYMKDDTFEGKQLPDYKFFCFNGKPELLFVAEDRFSVEGAKFTFLDLDWNVLNIHAKGHQGNGKPFQIPKPQSFDLMKEVVQQLCVNVPFVRIDVYLINNQVYFGEYTFFHDGGVVDFEPDEWNLSLGGLMKLPHNF